MCLDTLLQRVNVFKELDLQQSDSYIQFSRILIKFDILFSNFDFFDFCVKVERVCSHTRYLISLDFRKK